VAAYSCATCSGINLAFLVAGRIKKNGANQGTTAVVWELFGNLKKIVQPFTSEKIRVTFGNFGIELSLEVVG